MLNVTKLTIVLAALALSDHLALCQVIGEWALKNCPESEAYDVVIKANEAYLLVQSIPDIDTDQYDFTTGILKIVLDENDFNVENVYLRNSSSNRSISSRLSKIHNEWIITESSFTYQSGDSFYLNRMDEDFILIQRIAHPIHAELFHYCNVIYADGEYTGIGSIVVSPDSLVGVRYSSNSQDSTQINVFRTDPSIFFVSSMTYDSVRDRFLAFHYGGISHLDDTLGLIQRYPGSVIHTSQHGSVLSHDLHYYSFGASAFQGSPDLRDLVFQQYDTSMQIMFTDTFGRPGKDDYPFINQSLDVSNGQFYMGGMLAGPFNLSNEDTLKFFLAKYDQNLDKLWYREYGGSHSYVIRGLKALPDGGCLVYGSRVDNTDGVRYPYLLIVNEDGWITSAKVIQKPEPQLFEILYTAESEIMTISATQEIYELQIFSLDGKSIARFQNLLPGNHDLNLSFLPSGVYIILATNGKVRQSGKWVKR